MHQKNICKLSLSILYALVIYYALCSYFPSGVAAQMPGYEDKNGKFVFVPEMVPEFIVPDLTHFKVCTGIPQLIIYITSVSSMCPE